MKRIRPSSEQYSSQRRDPVRDSQARALAALSLVALAACTGGPHPLPPFKSRSAESGAAQPAGGLAQNPATGPAAGSATSSRPDTATQPPTGALPTTPNTGAPAMAGAAGSAASAPTAGAAATPPASTPAAGAPTTPSGAAGGGGTMGMQPADAGCSDSTGVLAPSAAAPTNMLLILDRSADMASDFEGAPRWQFSAQALSRTITPRAAVLTLGAVLYPSDVSADPNCTGPEWLCTRSEPAMCSVNAMGAEGQLPFQPASQALASLLDNAGVYVPATSSGAPLAESIDQANAALAQSPAGITSVVIVASGVPSCQWDAGRASQIVAGWYARGIPTYVIALPGSLEGTDRALAALAEAGGSHHVRTPAAQGAFDSALQSIAFGAQGSCTLSLDPPVTDPTRIRVLVSQDGIETELAAAAPTGEAQWMLSADGRSLTLLGAACAAAMSGQYDGVRIQLACSMP